MSRLITLVCAAFLIGNAAGEIYFKKGAPHVQLASKALVSGSVKFSRDGRPFSSFEGIPYATVAERFAESDLITEKQWEGVKSVVKPGPVCAQKVIPAGVGSLIGEEDCLFLNVYVPMNNTGKEGYPVMVWVHGGGFMYGAGEMYGPKYFMDEDVILVTVNYRLGVFGFLSTGDEVVPGNNGLKDVVNALRWVQENIKNFHGNPNKVTIFGESAGAASVHYLTLSPLTKGLFHRAISQSGTGLAPWAHEANPRKHAEKLAEYLGCPTTSSQEIVACLKEKPRDEINVAQFDYIYVFPRNIIPFSFGPTTEPKTSKNPFITESPWATLTNKNSQLVNDVPLMIGATGHEGVHMFAIMVLENEELLKEINDNWDKVLPNALLLEKTLKCPKGLKVVADKLKESYLGNKAVSAETGDAFIDLYSDGLFFHNVYRAALETALRSKRPQVYLYHYSHQSKFPLMPLIYAGDSMDATKVGHADELPFLFNLEGLGKAASFIEPDSKEEIFSKNLVRLWASFAKHGEPKALWGNVGKWNPVSKSEADGTETLKFLKIDKETTIINDFYKERMTLWNTIWEDILLKNPHTQADKTEL